MKRVLLPLLLIVLPSISFSYGSGERKKTASNRAIGEKIKTMELFDDVPKGKKFKKLGPVAGRCDFSTTMDCAVKMMKRQAAKIGADAIINVQMGSSRQSSAGYGGGIFYGVSSDHAAVNGWAIKWVE